MIDAITAALEAVSPTTRKRLRRCLPMLQEALATWGGMMPASGLLLACSTQHNGIVLRASGWPQFDPQAVAQSDRANAALGLVSAIENAPGTDMAELVIAAATVLLGVRGLAVHAQDVERIVQDGRARQRQTI